MRRWVNRCGNEENKVSHALAVLETGDRSEGFTVLSPSFLLSFENFHNHLNLEISINSRQRRFLKATCTIFFCCYSSNRFFRFFLVSLGFILVHTVQG